MSLRSHSARVVAVVLAVVVGLFAAAPATAAQTFSVVKAPQIEGTPRVGAWLKADIAAWKPAANFTYEWRRDGKVIPGATKQGYKLTPADVGHEIKLKVTGKKSGYTSVTRYSAATDPVRKGVFKFSDVSVSGIGKVGSTLTLNYSGLYPTDGTQSIQWKRDGKPISGATKATYKLTGADAGKKIAATITWSKAGYYTKSVTRALKTFSANATASVKGYARVGAWVKADGPNWGSKVSVSYQWLRNGNPISGATKPAYKATRADLNKRLTVRVTGERSGYWKQTVTSKPSNQVRKGLLTIDPPTFYGTQVVGDYISPHKYTGLNVSGIDFTYQWRRDGAPIAGETKYYYRVTAKDLDSHLSLRIKMTRPGYYSKAIIVTLKEFEKTPAPTLSGALRVDETVTINSKPWSDADERSIEIKANGEVVDGYYEFPFEFTPWQELAGKTITATVTSYREGYLPTSITTTLGKVRKGIQQIDEKPVLEGTPVVGAAVYLDYAWASMTDVKVEWLRDGKVISSAAGEEDYIVQAADAGHRIAVRVKYEREGYFTKSFTVALGNVPYSSSVPKTTLSHEGFYSPTGAFGLPKIKPGVYYSGSMEYCGVFSSTAPTFEVEPVIIQLGEYRGYVRVTSSDKVVYFGGCMDWKLSSSSQTPNGTADTDGYWRVGYDINPGVYKVSGATDSCRVILIDEPPATEWPAWPASTAHVNGDTIRITADTGYLRTFGCGTWQRVSALG